MRYIEVFFLIMIVTACRQDERMQRQTFSSLSEEDKRLPENALSSMRVADGLEVQLFASEPMITNPTNMSIDDAGRVWICEAYNYDVSPEQADEKGDRIVVLEDTDHDGKADKRTIFYQGTDVNTPLGILVTGDKVYVSRSPNVLVFTDTNGDLVADKKDTLFTNLGNKGDHSAHAVLPGPEGKLYFSTGNYAGEIKDRSGKAIVDRAGFTVNQKGNPYMGGMVMRFDMHGNSFEVLGHNFRNNYEPCLDSFGNIWQSDNDDDGYESCRINYLMPFGNYGFLDERTRAAWTANRMGMEKEISRRHWHQDDPGVVPNVLITGAGSPAGMMMYEGEQLPEIFHGMPIHAEPYYNVVRGYIVKKKEAGFTASTKDVLKSEDQWFRPIDVSTAPDGSVFVADWYDPILGGGAAGDANRGRIYRLAKKVNEYNIPRYDFKSINGLTVALNSPSPETRFAATHELIGKGEQARPALETLWHSKVSRERARAFWVLAQIIKGDSFLHEALADEDSQIRMAAIRFIGQYRKDVVPFFTLLKNDSDIHVRREMITYLRYASTPSAAQLWSDLAMQYDGNDRWYLEALGIGSDLHADLFFDAWLKKAKPDLSSKAHQDIIWRIRSKQSLPLLARIISKSTNAESTVRFFRAFDFHQGPDKNGVLLSLLELPGDHGKKISTLALQQIDPSKLKVSAKLQRALDDALDGTANTLAFIDLVAKYNLTARKSDLLKIAIDSSGSPIASAAVDQLIRFNTFDAMEDVLQMNDDTSLALLKSLNSKGNREIIQLAAAVVRDPSATIALRQQAVSTLGSSWPGEERLLSLVKDSTFSSELKPMASSVLFNVYRSTIQREAAKYLQAPQTKGSPLPSVKQLAASKGIAENGVPVFEKFCATCHRANDKGVKFGPELSQIGSKMSKDGMFRAIIYPDEGISHGFSASVVKLKDGSEVMGIITSQTNQEIELSLAGGVMNKYSRSQVAEIKAVERSIMPALAGAMTQQELVDLVAYLSTLTAQ